MTTKAQEELFSNSALAKRFHLDRATAAKRLSEAGVLPVKSSAKGKFYRLADAQPVLSRTKNPLDAQKLRKLEIEADLKELELQQERGDLVRTKEVRDQLQRIFAHLHQRIAMHYPKEISTQLYKAETSGQVEDILRTGLSKIFNELRTDPKSFF
jgi:hypothetical protein